MPMEQHWTAPATYRSLNQAPLKNKHTSCHTLMEDYMKKTLLLTTFAASILLPLQIQAADDYQVVFETMDCSGNTGFATVGAHEIYKINNGDCSNPEDPGKKLKQLLVHDGHGSYNVYTLTQEEARSVMGDVKEYMKSRKGLLDRSNSVIISH